MIFNRLQKKNLLPKLTRRGDFYFYFFLGKQVLLPLLIEDPSESFVVLKL